MQPSKTVRIYLGGGCFWSKEYHLGQVPGVSATQVGFMGGHKANPSYQEVCTKTTGHAEVVAVDYNLANLSTRELLIQFFSIHDPRIDRRAKGGQYRSAIFFSTEEQQQAATALIEELENKGHIISTEIRPASDFWLASDRHQQFCATKGLTPKPTKGLLHDLETVRNQTD